VIGHQVELPAAGGSYLTLEDLWPQPCRAVIVGVNPAPRSVALGHYYEGPNGKVAMRRLREAGLLPLDEGGYADDEAMAAGVGFTDVVKRPTPRARDLAVAELAAGRAELRAQLARRDVPLIVCVFKPAVEALLEEAGPPGFQPASFDGARVFRMPGPYAAADQVGPVMAQLRGYLSSID
jgi:TDG/mug DNA glycosylase family protein